MWSDPIQSDYSYSTCSETGGAGCEWFYGPIAYASGYTYMDIGTSSYFGAAQINGRVGYYGESGAFTSSWTTTIQFVWYVDFQDVLLGTPCFWGMPDNGNLSDKESGLVYSFAEGAIVGGTMTNVLDQEHQICGLGSGSWSESGYFYTPTETMCFVGGETYQLQSWMNVNDLTGAIGETSGATSDMGTGSYYAELIGMNFWTTTRC
jgi:hypothetical protein